MKSTTDERRWTQMGPGGGQPTADKVQKSATNDRGRGLTRPLDLSGAPQAAGGVGGLVEMAYYGTQTTNCCICLDGNGNVTALVNARDGTSAAQYEYGPFGEIARQTGPMAKANPEGFSTKYQDAESHLLYFGFRYLSTSTAHWASRDPVSDVTAGQALPGYQRPLELLPFVANNPVSQVDRDGRDWWPPSKWPIWPLPKPPPSPPTNPKRVSACCACNPGAVSIDRVKGQQTTVGTKPSDDAWVEVVSWLAKKCPELKPVDQAIDRAKKAFVGFSETYLSTGYTFNFYIEVEFRCCGSNKKWGPSQTIGPDQVTDDTGEGDYSLEGEKVHLTDFAKDTGNTVKRLLLQAQATCRSGSSSSGHN